MPVSVNLTQIKNKDMRIFKKFEDFLNEEHQQIDEKSFDEIIGEEIFEGAEWDEDSFYRINELRMASPESSGSSEDTKDTPKGPEAKGPNSQGMKNRGGLSKAPRQLSFFNRIGGGKSIRPIKNWGEMAKQEERLIRKFSPDQIVASYLFQTSEKEDIKEKVDDVKASAEEIKKQRATVYESLAKKKDSKEIQAYLRGVIPDGPLKERRISVLVYLNLIDLLLGIRRNDRNLYNQLGGDKSVDSLKAVIATGLSNKIFNMSKLFRNRAKKSEA